MEEKTKEYVFWVEDHPAEGPYDTIEAAIDDAQYYYDHEDDSVLGETVDGEICSVINLGYVEEYDTKHVAEQLISRIEKEGFYIQNLRDLAADCFYDYIGGDIPFELIKDEVADKEFHESYLRQLSTNHDTLDRNETLTDIAELWVEKITPADLFSVASIGKEYDLKARAWVNETREDNAGRN